MTRDPLRGIVFDKDGTLIDFNATWPPIFRVLSREIAETAGNPDLADALLLSGGQDPRTGQVAAGSAIAESSFETLADHWLSAHPEIADLGWPGGEKLAVWIRARALDLADEPRPVMDLAAFFGALRGRGLAIGVATNDSTAGARHLLDRHGLLDHVDFYAGCDAGHGAKPEPGMILAFCRETGRTPSETAMVGDSPADLLAGRAAGCGLVVGVLTGPSRHEDLEPYADVVIENIAGIFEVIS